MKTVKPIFLSSAALACLIVSCGRIVDPDSVVVARLDGDVIRQSALFKHLRLLSERDRPLIQTREDAEAALNGYINERILKDYAEDLRAREKIYVPRNLAKEAYFAKDSEYRLVYEIPDAALIDRTERDLEALRVQVDFGIDDEEDRLYREAALSYLAQEAFASGRYEVSDAELQHAYEEGLEELVRYEVIEFVGLQFPTTNADARAKAAGVLRRSRGGEDFDALVAEFRAEDPASVLESGFENNPNRSKFRTFWDVASGAEAGAVMLAFLPSYEIVTQTDAGRESAVSMPAAHIVFKVLEHSAERTLSIEEARDQLLPPILRERMMGELREKHGVEIYAEELSDPAGLGTQFKGSKIQTTNQ